MEEQTEKCNYCGRKYDSNCEGHEHFSDGGCECEYCLESKVIHGKKFCSPECEGCWVDRHQNNFPKVYQ
jgi:hypothetical protein